MSESSLDSMAAEIHARALAVDLHADTPVLLRFGYDLGQRHDPILPRGAAGFHLDLPRMREARLAGQFFALPSLPFRLPFRGRSPGQAVDRLLDALEAAERANSERFVLARTASELRAARHQGRIAGLRGIEGAHALDGSLDRAAHFARRGVVYLGLLHLSANHAGAPAYGPGRDDSSGLTLFGRELVGELNRLRVMIDLAHINKRGFLEAAALSHAPVIVSHTGVSGVHRHWRNIDDDQLRAVAKTGGCIGVIYSRRYLGCDDLDGVCDHLEYLIKAGGEDLPALGSDYDGLCTPPEGLEDVTGLPKLTARLLHRGLPERQVRKILSENALRVLESVVG